MHILKSNREEQLVERIRDGENQALRDFYALYSESLTAVCSRYIVNEEDLKDVFQEALIQIFTHIRQFSYRGDGSLGAWATKIVVNESLRFLKRSKIQEFASLDWDVTDEPEDEDPPVSNVPPDVLHRMICELPTGYRTVFNLYVFEDKSHKEIAELLGIKKDTSASQLSRAKNLLAKKIREYINLNQ